MLNPSGQRPSSRISSISSSSSSMFSDVNLDRKPVPQRAPIPNTNNKRSSEDIETILATSIQKAKQKLYSIDNSIQEKTAMLNNEYSRENNRNHINNPGTAANTSNFLSVNTVESREHISVNNKSQNPSGLNYPGLKSQVIQGNIVERKPPQPINSTGLSSISQSQQSSSQWSESNSGAVASAMKLLQDKLAQLQTKLTATEKQAASDKEKWQIEIKKLQAQKDSVEKQKDALKRQAIDSQNVRQSAIAQVELLKKAVDSNNKKLQKMREDKQKLSAALAASSASKHESKQHPEDIAEINKLKHIVNSLQTTISSLRDQLRNQKSLFEARLNEQSQQKDSLISQLRRQKDALLTAHNTNLNQQSIMANSTKQQNILILEENKSLSERVKELERTISEHVKLQEYNRIMVSKLESDLDLEKQRNSQALPRHVEAAYVEKINILEDQIQSLRNNKKKHANATAAAALAEDKIHRLQEQNQKLRDRYESLLMRFERTEKKWEAEQKETKLYRDKFQRLKDVQKELGEKLRKMPGAVTNQIKYLLTEASKLQKPGNSSAERGLDRSQRGRSKSGDKLNKSGVKTRKISQQSNQRSSAGKRKPLKMEDLDQSRNSVRSISGTRSRVLNQMRQRSQKSDAKSKRSRKSSFSNLKLKQSLVDTETDHKKPIESKILDMTDRQFSLATQINLVQNRVLQIRREYKALATKLNSDPDNEVNRLKLNELTLELEIKSEELAELKKKYKQAGTDFPTF